MNGKLAKRLRKKAIGHKETTYKTKKVVNKFRVKKEIVELFVDCKRKHYKELKKNVYC